MDPLTLLRDFVTLGKVEEISVSGERIDFGGRYSFGKSVSTSYKSQQGKEGFYDLESLVFFVRNTVSGGVKFGDYFKNARQAGLMPISALDRKDLEEYLTGKRDKSDYIQLTLPDLQVGDQEPEAKRARVESSTAASTPGGDNGNTTLRGIRAFELQLRDRNSMLTVPNRNLSKVLTLLASVQKEEMRRAAAAKPQQKTVLPVKGSGRYERQTQQDARLRQLGADVLGTVETGFVTAAGAAVVAQNANGAPPPPPPPASAPQPKTMPPVAAQPSSSEHRSSGSSSHRRDHAQNHAPPTQQHRSGARPGSGASQRPRSGTPIIMVPPALTSLVNMYNIQPFLEQGVFRTVEECKAELTANGVKKQDLLKITRTMGRSRPVTYHVTDKEPERKEDWRRVVAVFCLGKPWQFKKWPHKGAASGDLVDTFSRVRGCFLHYNDEKVDPTVKGWNVKIVGLNRTGRHRDITVVQEFWTDLDAFLKAQKSTLAY